MIIKGSHKIDIKSIKPGDTIKISIKKDTVVNSLYKHANEIGCKLILLNYGEFYFKDHRNIKREKIIDDLLE